jgi:hypothetical protein
MNQETLELFQEIVIELSDCYWGTSNVPLQFVSADFPFRGLLVEASITPECLTLFSDNGEYCHISTRMCGIELSCAIENLYRKIAESQMNSFATQLLGVEDEDDA